MRMPFTPLLAAVAASFLLTAAGARAEESLGAKLDGLLAYARERNPEFAAVRAEAAAANEHTSIRPVPCRIRCCAQRMQ